MKRVIFLLLTAVFFGSLCFAEEAQAPAQDTPAKDTPPAALLKTRSFIGFVSSVFSGDAMAGMRPQIIVLDASGRQWNFTVADDATVIDKNGDATSLNWLGKGTKVEIRYTETQDGPKIARSIKVMSGW